MKKEVVDKIHFTGQQFKKAIENDTGIRKVFIAWVIFDDREARTYSGITLSEGITPQELPEALFQINGRAYGMINIQRPPK